MLLRELAERFADRVRDDMSLEAVWAEFTALTACHPTDVPRAADLVFFEAAVFGPPLASGPTFSLELRRDLGLYDADDQYRGRYALTVAAVGAPPERLEDVPEFTLMGAIHAEVAGDQPLSLPEWRAAVEAHPAFKGAIDRGQHLRVSVFTGPT